MKSIPSSLNSSTLIPSTFFRSCLLMIGFLASGIVNSTSAQESDSGNAGLEKGNVARPNIVMFFIDDLGYMDLGCNGSKGYSTPNIDRLASKSVNFRNFYSANPVCSPTRAALMTGKAPHRLGITQWINQPNELHLPLSEVTIAEALAEHGYENGYIGKWHLGEKDHQLPDDQGFQWMKCVNRGGAPGSYFFPYKRKKKRNSIAYWDVPDLDDRKEGDYLTDEMTDLALEFIEEEKSGPFFLCFAHYAVHTPIQAPAPLVKKYQEKFSSLPKLERTKIAERNGGMTRPRQDNPTYAAMIENLDSNVGRVLGQLDKLGLTENTIIVFTSDNGGLSTVGRVGPTCCLPLRAGKGWTYEGGIRIPTLISWADKIPPKQTDTLGITMDLYPTLLELTGIPLKPEQHTDGVSLKSDLLGRPVDSLKDRFLAWTYPHHHGSKHSPSNAIRMGNWKLIHRTDDASKKEERLELYNLANDLGEKNNVADQQPERTQQMLQQLNQWLK